MKRLTALDAALFCFALVAFGFLAGIRTAMTADELARKRVKTSGIKQSRYTTMPGTNIEYDAGGWRGNQ